MKSNHDRPSMPDKRNKQGRQMTLRESDGCIVPLNRKDQLRGSKPGNAGAGKAAKPSRDPDPTPTALSGGRSVRNRPDHIFAGTRELLGRDSSGRLRRPPSRSEVSAVCLRACGPRADKRWWGAGCVNGARPVLRGGSSQSPMAEIL